MKTLLRVLFLLSLLVVQGDALAVPHVALFGSVSGVCGDGRVSAVEECDDGNLDSADGCGSTCLVEAGWDCDGASPSTCADGPIFWAPLLTDLVDDKGAAVSTYTRATTATGETWAGCATTPVGTLATIASGTRRHDSRCSGTTLHTGLMAEPAGQNTALQSQTLGTTWVNAGLVITNNQGVDRFGNTTLEKIDNTGATNTTSVYQVTTSPSTTTYVVSITANTDGASDVVSVRGQGCSSLSACSCTISEGSCTAANGGTICYAYATITKLTRLSAMVTCGSAITAPLIAVQPGRYLASTGTALFGEAQVEIGPYPSSYIPTTTTAGTRNADVARWALASQSTGSLSASVLCPNADVTASTIGLFSLSDGTADNTISLMINPTGDKVRLDITSAATPSVALDDTGAVDVFDGAPHTVRATWSSTDGSATLYVDGVESSDSSATPPTTDRVIIGSPTGVAGGCLVWALKVHDVEKAP